MAGYWLKFSTSNNRTSVKPHWLRYRRCAKLVSFVAPDAISPNRKRAALANRTHEQNGAHDTRTKQGEYAAHRVHDIHAQYMQTRFSYDALRTSTTHARAPCVEAIVAVVDTLGGLVSTLQSLINKYYAACDEM